MCPKFWSNHCPRKQKDPLPVDVSRLKTLLLEPPGECQQQRQSHYRYTTHENLTRQTALCPTQRRSLHPRSSQKPPLSLAFENTPIFFRGRGIVWFIHTFFISQYNSLFWVLGEAPGISFTCLFGHQQRIMENYLNKNIASR